MKKAIIATLAAILLLILIFLGALLYGRLSSMSALKIEHPEIALGPLPISKTYVGEILPGMPFRIDTGSSVNTISHAYIDRLKKMGYQVDSSRVLTLVYTAIGGRRLATKRYRVSLPVFSYNFKKSGDQIISSIDTLNRINMVEGMDFVLVGHENEIPRFGRPFLNKFAVELDYKLKALRFHPSVPKGYQEMDDIHTNFALFYEPSMFIEMLVKGQPRRYFMNSSMPRVVLLEPAGTAPQVNSVSTFNDTIKSVYGNIPAVIDYNTWVEWADRAGNSVAYYADYGHEPFAINPFNFLTQDAVFDFRNGKIYLRPYSPKARHLRDNDIAIVDDTI